MQYSYQLHPLELSEYTCLYPDYTNLDVKMYIDECSSYKRWNHPLWIIISKGDPYIDTWVSISISQNPQIKTLNSKNDKFQISDNDISKCLEFINKFKNILKDIANEKVDSDVIYDIIDSCVNWRDCSKFEIEECYDDLKTELLLTETDVSFPMLSEMAILRTEVTGIDPFIWIEQDARTTQHNIERIKFQVTDSTNPRTFFPILLKPEGAEISDKSPCPVPLKKQREVIEFVNKYRAVIEAFIKHEFNDQRILKQLIKNGYTEWPVSKEILDSLLNPKIKKKK